MEQDIPIELDCWMLRWGVLPMEHLPANPDVVWPEPESDHAKAVRTGIGMGWKPSFDGEEPPY
jgi:hypothetical protein